MSILLKLEGVTLALGGREVLHDVSFGVQRGETKVILGASGSGKSTILKLILGLIRPDRGSIRINGRDTTQLDERELQHCCREHMAMVFQNAALFDSLTVRENVGYRLWERGTRSGDEIEKIVEESLRFVGLDDVLEKMPAELSGGMRKRVGIARALASGAEVILYDEPTAGLDPINTCLITRLILKLKAQHVTQIVVTHDLKTADSVAESILMIQRGRVIFEGTSQEMKQSHDQEVRFFIDPGCRFDHEHEATVLPRPATPP
ncbi:MAG: ATP-binding cassette domain-containing protein [Nitrospirales bacterium]|nr:ATP-binding cassette domain-containing protein [Nitrospirales bacterium]